MSKLSPWFLSSPYAAYVPPYTQRRDNTLGTIISNFTTETPTDAVKQLVIASGNVVNGYYIRLQHFFRVSTTGSPLLTVAVRGGMGGENPITRGLVWGRQMTTVASSTTTCRLTLNIATEGQIPPAAPGATGTIITRCWGDMTLNNIAEPVATQSQAATCNYFNSLPPNPNGSFQTMVFCVTFGYSAANVLNTIRPEYTMWELFPTPGGV